MTDQTEGWSPRLTARIAGATYLLMALSGGLGAFARRGLIVSGDAVATATNILAHEPRFLLSFAGEILVTVWYVATVALFYVLFRPVNRSLSLIASFLGLAGCTIQAAACAFYLAPLSVLGDARYLKAIQTEPRQALAYLFLRLYSQTYGLALIFFGSFMLLIGYLIFRSTFLPRTLGVLWVLAGLGGLTFLSPPFGAKALPYVMAGGIGELLLAMWLLVVGVDVPKWREKARRVEGVGA